MKATKMLRTCKLVLQELEDLEEMLPFIPGDQRADQFIHESRGAVTELQLIAKFETVDNVTSEQALHIRTIQGRINKLRNMVPEDIRKEFGD